MYPSVSGILQKNQRRQGNRPRLAKPAAHPIATPLALPTLAGVPVRYTENHGANRVATVLLAFMECGLIEEADLQAHWTAEEEILQRAITRWLEREGKGLEIFHPHIVFGDYCEDYSDREKLSSNTMHIIFGASEMQYGFMGKGVEAIEASAPGLGKTLLHYLYSALNSTLYSVSPNTILDTARFTYWQGCDDEKEALEEIAAMGEEPEDFEIFSRADLFKNMPEWAAEPEAVLADYQIAALLRHQDKKTRAAAKAVQELAGLLSDTAYTPPKWLDNEYRDCVNPAIFLRWADHDAMEQVFDDFYQYVIQTECATDLHGLYEVELTVTGITEGLEQTGKLLKRLHAAEQAIKLVATIK